MTSIPLSPKLPCLLQTTPHHLLHKQWIFGGTEVLHHPLVNKTPLQSLIIFVPSVPQTPTSIKTGLTLDPYFSHEGFQS